jgi:hypothetical protein
MRWRWLPGDGWLLVRRQEGGCCVELGGGGAPAGDVDEPPPPDPGLLLRHPQLSLFFFENMGHCHSGRPAGLPRRSPGWVCVGKKKANNPDRPITAVQLERPGLPRNSQQPTTGSNCIFVSGGHPTCIFFILLFSIYIYPTVGRLADAGGQEDANTGGVLGCTRGSSTASR